MNASPSSPHPARETTASSASDWMRLTQRYVDSLQYGQVTLTVHQGEVIEVQKTERTRLNTKRR